MKVGSLTVYLSVRAADKEEEKKEEGPVHLAKSILQTAQTMAESLAGSEEEERSTELKEKEKKLSVATNITRVRQSDVQKLTKTLSDMSKRSSMATALNAEIKNLENALKEIQGNESGNESTLNQEVTNA